MTILQGNIPEVLRLPSFVAPHSALKCDLKIFQHHWLLCLLPQNLHRSHPWIQDIAENKKTVKASKKALREWNMKGLILKPWPNRLASRLRVFSFARKFAGMNTNEQRRAKTPFASQLATRSLAARLCSFAFITAVFSNKGDTSRS